MSQTENRQMLSRPAAAEEKAISFVPFGATDVIKLSVSIIQNVVAVPTKTGQTCSQRDAMKFLMMCQAQRLNPFAGDAYLVGYDTHNQGPKFNLITAHQALLKRAETSQDFEGMESGIILLMEDNTIIEREGDFHLDGENVVGGWARVYRRGRKPTYRRIAISQRKPTYETAFWSGNKAAEQIVKCSEADALRATFPTLLGGLYIVGEHDGAADRIVTQMVSRPMFETPAKLEAPKPEEKPAAHSDEGEGTDLGPQAASAASPESKAPVGEEAAHGSANIGKALRLLLKHSKHTEGELLDYLRSSGKLDESIRSLEEALMVAEPTLRAVYDGWKFVDAELRKLKEKA